MATSVQPSQATSGASNDRSGTRLQRPSPRQNLTIPYPPGYAVSASDSEHISTREHVSSHQCVLWPKLTPYQRTKITENARSIERPRTSGGHRASIAHDAVSRPPVTHPLQPTHDKNPPKVEVCIVFDPPKAYQLITFPRRSHQKVDLVLGYRTGSHPTPILRPEMFTLRTKLLLILAVPFPSPPHPYATTLLKLSPKL